MTIQEKIQYDLDAGRFYGICSNEETFKSYVFKKIEEARKDERDRILKYAEKLETGIFGKDDLISSLIK